MKGDLILLDHLGDTESAVLIRDGRIEDALIDSTAPRPGTIYRARADRPVKGQGGMFVQTPDGSGFLRQVKGLSPGQMLLVQVTGYAEPGKAIPLTTKVLFKSRYAIATPGAPGVNVSRQIRDDDIRDALLVLAHETLVDHPFVTPDGDAAPMGGVILRSACAEASQDEVAEDLLAMVTLADQVLSDPDDGIATLHQGDGPHALAWRDWTDPARVQTNPGCFDDHGAHDMLLALLGPVTDLGGGASTAVEPTRAFVAVDVNTGSDTSLAAGLKANIAAARDLPRQLRLRGLGGQIVMDLAPMPKKDRRGFESVLRAAFRSDEVDTVLAGWTPLGNYELQRKRARLPLAQVLNVQMLDPDPAENGTGS